MSELTFEQQMAMLLFMGDDGGALTSSTPMSREAGTLDSMGEVEIVYIVEDRFGIKVTFDEVKNIGTYGAFLKLLKSRGANL